MLTAGEALTAKLLFGRWFKAGGAKNPTDINTRAKYEFAVSIGWEQFALMQRARKDNVARNNYPFPWTKKEYWR